MPSPKPLTTFFGAEKPVEKPVAQRSLIQEVGLVLLIAAAYFLAARFGLSLAFVNASATAVWPPTGIAIAALLLLGYRFWPGVFLGAFSANLATAGTIATSIGIATGNTIEALVAVYLINKFANGKNVFETGHGVMNLVLIALIATAISATIGVVTLVWGGLANASNFYEVWLTWWLGDLAGALIVAPLLIVWSLSWKQELGAKNVRELLLVFFLLIVSSFISFHGIIGFPHHPLVFIVIPFMLWISFRFAQLETVAAVVALCAIALTGTLRGFGPFATLPANEGLIILQLFISSVSVMCLLISALMQERLKAFEALNQSYISCYESEKIAGLAVWEVDLKTNVIKWSDELYEIFGTSRKIPITFDLFFKYLYPEDRAKVKELLKNVIMNHQSFSLQHRIIDDSGETKWLYTKGWVLTDENGHATKLIGFSEDVSEREKILHGRGKKKKNYI